MIPGFHPDPSVVLVDGVYYLVTSTFEYLPALPIHRSTDLVTWEHIGNVATRPSQVGVEHVPTPGGVWAPTIRHRDGVFYVVISVFLGGRGCVVFTATDPAGPWSDGTPIPAVDGIDPDLAWDDDGTAYVTFARYPDAIRQVRVDLATGESLEKPRALWAGSGLYAPEGPHLYRRGEHWYLLVAEGGTDRGHAVSVARGPSPEGPWETCPHNPVLTAAGTGSPVQNAGHADLVDAPGGGTAIVHLGVRPVGLAQAFSPLGRETFVSTVEWVDGWPRPRLPELGAAAPETFDGLDLDDPGWLAVRRTPSSVGVAAGTGPGNTAGTGPEDTAGTGPEDTAGTGLVITADGSTLDDPRPCFVGRRQRHLRAAVSVRVDASAGTGGLACRWAEDHWFALEVSGGTVTARARLAGLSQTWEAALPPGEVDLRIEMTPPPSDFSANAVGGDRIRLLAGDVVLTELDGRYWSFEVAKSMTGRVVGPYAVHGTVRFTHFHYAGGA